MRACSAWTDGRQPWQLTPARSRAPADACASAWSAAARARSSAPSTASPRGSTTATRWSPARSRRTRRGPRPRRRSSASQPSAPTTPTRRWRGPRRRAGDGIDVVTIVTPNHLHHGPAKAFLEAGIHVICDKPLTTTLDDALDLVATVRRTGRVFVLTHNYTGYPMVRQARAMVAAGELGPVRPGAG